MRLSREYISHQYQHMNRRNDEYILTFSIERKIELLCNCLILVIHPIRKVVGNMPQCAVEIDRTYNHFDGPHK